MNHFDCPLPANSTQCAGPPWWNGGPPTCTTTSSPTNWVELTIACQTSVHVTLPVDFSMADYDSKISLGNNQVVTIVGNGAVLDARKKGPLFWVHSRGHPDAGIHRVEERVLSRWQWRSDSSRFWCPHDQERRVTRQLMYV